MVVESYTGRVRSPSCQVHAACHVDQRCDKIRAPAQRAEQDLFKPLVGAWVHGSCASLSCCVLAAFCFLESCTPTRR